MRAPPWSPPPPRTSPDSVSSGYPKSPCSESEGPPKCGWRPGLGMTPKPSGCGAKGARKALWGGCPGVRRWPIGSPCRGAVCADGVFRGAKPGKGVVALTCAGCHCPAGVPCGGAGDSRAAAAFDTGVLGELPPDMLPASFGNRSFRTANTRAKC